LPGLASNCNCTSAFQEGGIKAGCWWLTPGILATQEAEIRRNTVQSQPRQIVPRDPISKKPFTKKKKKRLMECLRVQALSSNPRIALKKKKRGWNHRLAAPHPIPETFL
jgi:hypothetical protein